MRAHRRDARGATAVLVTVMSMVIFGLAAIVVDLGLARDTRRSAQNAADASALAAANELYKLNINVPNIAQAVTAAKSYAQKNHNVPLSAWATCTDPAKLPHQPGGTPCISFDSATTPNVVRVRIPTRTVKTGLGNALGVSEVPVNATSEATVERGSPEAGPMRPWGICSKRLLDPGRVTFLPMKDGSSSGKDPTADCGNEGPPGGWWIAQCIGQSNGIGATRAAVQNGCNPDSYTPVPGQPNPGTPTTLRQYLQGYCPGGASTYHCLSNDTGNSFSLTSPDWQLLVGSTIRMPVLCFPPQCDTGAYASTGSGASYAIYRIAKVEICGFHLPPSAPSTAWPTVGPCATKNPKNYTSADVTSGAGFFGVIKSVIGPGGETIHHPEPVGVHLSK